MNLQESIRRILRKDKDPTKLIKKIIDSSNIFEYKHFCGVDIINPEERTDQYNFLDENNVPFLIKVYFIGGPNSKVWPRTQGIRNNELHLIDDLRSHIKSFVPFNIEIMGSHVNTCDGYDKLMKRKYSTDELQESIKRILREELNVPQPGESSGKPLSNYEMGNMDCDTDYLTIDEILDGRIQRIPYYKEVLHDVLNDDYSWGVTNKVVEYARFMKQNPKSLKNLPPIIVVDDVTQDGAHRISAIYLLQNYMDKNNPLWREIELEVKFCYK